MPAMMVMAGLLGSCRSERIASETKLTQSEALIQTVKLPSLNEENTGIRRVRYFSRELQRIQTRSLGLPAVIPLELEGSIAIAGSRTVFPITAKMVERFLEEGFPGTIRMATFSTRTAFELFCQADSQIAIVNSGRLIREEEIQSCQAAGRKPIGFQVGTDAVTLVTSALNDFLPSSLSDRQIKAILTAERWSEVDANWPNELINKMLPDSDTLSFNLVGLLTETENQEPEARIRPPKVRYFKDEDILLGEALTNENTIGFVSYRYAKENQEVFRILAINGISPSVRPNYPLRYPLHIYTDTQLLQDRPEIRAFMTYYLTHLKDAEKDTNLTMSAEILAASRQKLQEALRSVEAQGSENDRVD